MSISGNLSPPIPLHGLCSSLEVKENSSAGEWLSTYSLQLKADRPHPRDYLTDGRYQFYYSHFNIKGGHQIRALCGQNLHNPPRAKGNCFTLFPAELF